MNNPHITSFLNAKHRGCIQPPTKYESPESKSPHPPQRPSFPVRSAAASKPLLQPKMPFSFVIGRSPLQTLITPRHQSSDCSQYKQVKSFSNPKEEPQRPQIMLATKKDILIEPPKGTKEVQVSVTVRVDGNIEGEEQRLTKPVRVSVRRSDGQPSGRYRRELDCNLESSDGRKTQRSRNSEAFVGLPQLYIFESWQKAEETIECSLCGKTIQILDLFQHHQDHKKDLEEKFKTNRLGEIQSSFIVNEPDFDDESALRFSSITQNTNTLNSTVKKFDFSAIRERNSLLIPKEKPQQETPKAYEPTISLGDSIKRQLFSGSSSKQENKAKYLWNFSRRLSENVSTKTQKSVFEDHEDHIRKRIESLHPE